MRRYRLLLLAYPRAYRRTRGTEILATLQDAAEFGGSRRQALGLLAGGLRCRLRVRGGPAVAVAAAVGALLCGLVLAAGGQRLGWQAAGPLPDARTAAGIAAMVPRQAIGPERKDYLFASAGGIAAADPAYPYRIGPSPDGPGLSGYRDYGAGAILYTFATPAGGPGRPVTPVLAARLRAAGWHVTGPTTSTLTHTVRGTTIRQRTNTVTAYRGATHLVFTVQPYSGPDGALQLTIDRTEPVLAPVLMAAGFVVGALAGWLCAAWTSRRLANRALPVRLLAAVLAAGTLLVSALGWLPGVVSLVSGYRFEGQGGPLWIGFMTAPTRPAALLGLLGLVVLLALAARPAGRTREPAAQPT